MRTGGCYYDIEKKSHRISNDLAKLNGKSDKRNEFD
jgi:hypothetical protein